MPGCGVFLVTSDHLQWPGVRLTLDSLPGVTVIGEARTAEAAIAAVREQRPDAVLLPARLNGASTAPLVAALHAIAPAMKTAVLADELAPAELAALLEASTDGYLLWSHLNSSSVAASVRAVLTDDIMVISGDLRSVLLEATRAGHAGESPDTSLTERETNVLRRLAAGQTRETIARELGVSRRTVTRVVEALLKAFGARSELELGSEARARGVL